MANINVFTEGFDAPNVDMAALLRATVSPGLYYQMVGRGLRTSEGKENCLVLDFGGNVERHGPIDAMVVKSKKPGEKGEPPAKTCPSCKEVVTIQTMVCLDCGYEWPEPEKTERHGSEASEAAILTSEIKTVEFDVEYMTFQKHVKRNAGEYNPPTMRVTYWFGDQPVADEWICVEHMGWARQKAMEWWMKRSAHSFPDTVEDAVAIGSRGGIAETYKVYTRQQAGTRFSKIVRYELGEVPEQVDLDEEIWEEPF